MKRAAIAAATVLVTALVGGVGAFAADRMADSGVSDRPGGKLVEIVPSFPVNAEGETYGRADGIIRPEDEPDLILAQATNGNIGYVRKSDLDEASGAGVSNPSEAIAWERAKPRKAVEIPVFETDGISQIGWFEVVPTFAETGD